jgi:hypothetical protein
MARTKVYTKKELEAITAAGPGKWLKPGRGGVHMTEGNEMYVLVEPRDPDYAQWLHPTEGLVDLYNTHQTGELRWDVRAAHPGADDLVAVLQYGLVPADMPPEAWRALLEKQKFELKDLSDLERELIQRTDDQGKGEVKRPPDNDKLHNAIWDAMSKGLVYMTGEMSGGGGADITFYRLTPKGRRLKAGKKRNPRKKIQPSRRRSADVRTRARNDRLRRIMRGV